jgi:hypothetical protein
MRQGLVLAIGLSGVLLLATSAAARGHAFFGVGVGAPVHSFLGVPHNRVFFSTSFGRSVPPGLVTPRVLVALPGFVPQATIVLTPQTIIEARTPVLVTTMPARGLPPPVVLVLSARAASPVLVPAPSVRRAPPVIIVVTPR